MRANKMVDDGEERYDSNGASIDSDGNLIEDDDDDALGYAFIIQNDDNWKSGDTLYSDVDEALEDASKQVDKFLEETDDDEDLIFKDTDIIYLTKLVPIKKLHRIKDVKIEDIEQE